MPPLFVRRTRLEEPLQDQGSVVITYTIGSSWMRFCYHRYGPSSAKKTQYWFQLRAGEALVWVAGRAPTLEPEIVAALSPERFL